MTSLHALAALVRAQAAAGQTDTLERGQLREALQGALAGGTKLSAAEALGVPRSTLDRWLELAGLDVARGWATR